LHRIASWKINAKLNTQKTLNIFYSQTNGQKERVNQKLEQYLRMFIDYNIMRAPKKVTFYAFEQLIYNLKTYNGIKL